MRVAIAEARHGIGLTSPNPPVGAAIIKNDTLLGKGWHTMAGAPHAEPEAIADALSRHHADELVGATIYVTLEPCSTLGRTPPCTLAILNAGISRVVYAAEDPNPHHAGRAKTLLESAGLSVTTGIEKEAATHLIRAFSKRQRTGLPWVILKSAISLDGRITRPPGEGQWLTSPASREIVQRLRFESDAIITGGNTLRIDDPSLTIRSASFPKKEQPWRMVITRREPSSLPRDKNLFQDKYAHRTLVQGNGDLHAALKTLADLGCNSVLVEAGGTLTGAFLDAGLADEVAIFYAPLLTGGNVSGFCTPFTHTPLHHPSFTRIGNDILLRATLEPHA